MKVGDSVRNADTCILVYSNTLLIRIQCVFQSNVHVFTRRLCSHCKESNGKPQNLILYKSTLELLVQLVSH